MFLPNDASVTINRILSAGSNTVYALNDQGYVYAWGSGGSGQLGNSTAPSINSPPTITYRRFSAVTGEGNYAYGIDYSSGLIYSWGANSSGNLGDNNSTTNQSSPISVAGGRSYSKFSSGGGDNGSFSAIEGSTGRAYCWGSNIFGDCGDNSSTARSSPVSVLGGRSWSSISSGSNLTSAIEGSTGNAYCWGFNINGQLGNNSTTSSSSPVSVVGGLSFTQIVNATQASLGLTGGLVYGWGSNTSGQLGNNTVTACSSPVLGTFVASFNQISGSGSAAAGIEISTGNVYCWGLNTNGQLGDGTVNSRSIPLKIPGTTSFSQIIMANGFALALEASTNKIWGWGYNGGFQLLNSTYYHQTSPVSVVGGRSFSKLTVTLTAGIGSALAIEGSTGNAYSWGNNSSKGQLGDGTASNRSSPVSVLGGRSYSSAIADTSNATFYAIEGSTGNAYGWGNNALGALGDNATVSNKSSPISVVGGRSFSSIASAQGTAVALEGSTGNAYCWGAGANGTLGNNSVANQSSPVSVQGGRSFKTLSQNGTIVAIEATTGNAYCWGGNSSGQCGDGLTSTGRSSPVSVVGGRSFSSAVPGLVIEGSTGHAYAWGANSLGQLGDGTTNARSSPTSVIGGRSFSSVYGVNTIGLQLAIEGSTGNAYAFGLGAGGYLGNNGITNQSSPVSVLGGRSFKAIFIGQASGTPSIIGIEGSTGLAYAWGNNATGQLGDGSFSNRSSPVSVLGGRSFNVINKTCINATSYLIEASSGNIWSTGSMTAGALGNGNDFNVLSPTLIGAVIPNFTFPQINPLSKIGAGDTNSFAINRYGLIYGWGSDANGELGNSATNTDSSVPTLVTNGQVFTKVRAGNATTIALENSTGNLYGWGNNPYGQIGDGTINAYSSPISVLGGRSFRDLFTNIGSSFAIEGSTGNAYAWGQNFPYGTLGDNTTANKSSPVSVVGGRSWSRLGLSVAIEASTGNAYAWGYNGGFAVGDNTNTNRSSPTSVVGGRSFKEISGIGGNSVTALEGSTGNAWTWGTDYNGTNTGINSSSPISVPGGKSFIQLSPGYLFNVVLDGNNQAWAWGDNSTYQLGDSTITNRSSPVSVLGGRSFSDIVCGQYYTLATEIGTGLIWTWGYNSDGQFGNGFFHKYSPVSVLGGRSISQIIPGDQAITIIEASTGNTYAWGYNASGQVGNNTVSSGNGTSVSSPVSVLGGYSFKQIQPTGSGGFVALEASTGRAFGWGNNGAGQLGIGPDLTSKSSPTSVFGGQSWKSISGCPLVSTFGAIEGSTGNAYMWGFSNHGILGNNGNGSASNPVSVYGARSFSTLLINVGTYNALAIEATTGNIYCWGG